MKAIRSLYQVGSVSDIPSRLGPADVVLVDTKWAVLGCPCRCGELLWLNLMENAGRRWRASLDGDKITLSPSVWSTTECKSHFWVRSGRIRWV